MPAEAVAEARLVGWWIVANSPPALELSASVGAAQIDRFLARNGVNGSSREAERLASDLLRTSRKRTALRRGSCTNESWEDAFVHTPFVRSAVVIEHDVSDVDRCEVTTTDPRDFRCP